MPTYQYACTECGHRFEQFQAFSDASLTDCPVCAGKLRKVYGSVGVVFKGSGFYRTDSRAGAAAGSEKSEKSDAAASTPADSGKVAAKESTSAGAKSSDAGSSSSTSSTNGSSTNGSSTTKAPKTGKPAAAAKSTG